MIDDNRVSRLENRISDVEAQLAAATSRRKGKTHELVKYLIMAALISIAVIAVISHLGTKMNEKFQGIEGVR